MRVVSVNAFLRRQLDCRTQVLEFRDDEHQIHDPVPIGEEMVNLAKMDEDEVRGRLRYKILDTCQQARKLAASTSEAVQSCRRPSI